MKPIWMDLANSNSEHQLDETGVYSIDCIDRLDDPQWLKDFLARHSVADDGLNPAYIRRSLRKLRALLRQCVEALYQDQTIPAEQLQALNSYLRQFPVVRQIAAGEDGYELEAEPRCRGINILTGTIAAEFVNFLVHGAPRRLRLCANDDCHWVFYDDTRGSTKRWCDPACGNLARVRKFRQRKSAAGG